MSARPGTYGNDFSLPELAVTKEEHDRLMAKRNRPLTDGPIGRHPHFNPLSLADIDANGRAAVEK